MSKNKQLHEILAVDQDRANSASAAISETLVTFTKKATHFTGQTRTVNFFDETRQGEDTVDQKAIDDTVMSRLEFMGKRVSPSYDTLMTKEATNQNAVADVVIDGVTIIENAPSTYLLAMEKRLSALVDTYRSIPTLAPSVEWDIDESAEFEGVYKSSPQTQMKTEKVLGSVVLYDATPEHPAQIKETSQDKSVARIETIHFSGMISPARKARILDRLAKMISAFKQARQRANTTEIQDRKSGKAIFDYLHSD